MSVKIIIEQFDLFNETNVRTNYFYNTIHGSPSFQIRFYVKNPYFSEDVEGNKQFSRKYRKKFKEFRTNFCKKYEKIVDPGYQSKELEPLELANTIVKELSKAIQNEFVIEGAIELYTIELVGVWEVYNAPKNMSLASEFNNDHV